MIFPSGYFLVQNISTGRIYKGFPFMWQANDYCEFLEQRGLAARVVTS